MAWDDLTDQEKEEVKWDAIAYGGVTFAALVVAFLLHLIGVIDLCVLLD